MFIKEANVNHAAQLAFIIREANKPTADEFGINQDNNPKHPSFCDADWVKADLERGERYFVVENYIAENDIAENVACVAYELSLKTSKTSQSSKITRKAYLNRLSVLPEHQSKGIGAQLVAFVIEQAKLDQINVISIGIISQHAKLRAWYESLGFITGETKHFGHLPFDVTYMSYNVRTENHNECEA